MPKRTSQERDKRSRDRQNELQQKKRSRNTKKAQGRESAISLPMINRCNPKLLQAISDYSLHASYFWWHLPIITNLFFNWCVHHGHVPPLNGTYHWDVSEQRYKWIKAKSRIQTLFRNVMMLEAYSNKPAGY
jgi:hypothetical protein